MFSTPSVSELRSSVQVISFNSGLVGYGQNEFTKRVGFSVAMPSANISFYINNTQESDSGLYSCTVLIPRGPAIAGQVQLNVKGNETNILHCDYILRLSPGLCFWLKLTV